MPRTLFRRSLLVALPGFLLLLPTVNCGGNSRTEDPAPIELKGTYIRAGYRPDGSKVDTPINLNFNPVEAQVENGKGGFDTYPADGTVEGTYSVKVPADTKYYWLKRGSQYFWTNQTTLDLGDEKGADRVGYNLIVQGAGGKIAFTGSGLDTVQANDTFGVWCPNLRFSGGNKYSNPSWYNILHPSTALNPPAVGGTTFTNSVVKWDNWPAFDSSKGDLAVLNQARKTVLPSGLQYWSIIKSGAIPPFNTIPDGTAEASGIVLSDPPPYPGYGFHLARSKWEAFKDVVMPYGPSSVVSRTVGVYSLPHGLARGHCDPVADLTVLQVVGWPADETVDISEPDLPIRTALDPSTLVHSVLWQYFYRSPEKFLFYNYSLVESTTKPTAANPITPLPPITNVRINGKALDPATPLTGVGVNPVISWTLPAGVNVSGVEILIARLTRNPASSLGLGTLFVPGDVTSVRVPADLMIDGWGYSYLLGIRTKTVQGLDMRKAPNKLGLPQAYTDFFTPEFKP